MKGLSIPMHRSSQTTRQPWRVVWLLAVVFLPLIAVWTGTAWWLARDTVTVAAPDDTILIVRFTPTPQTWATIEETLGNLPLISNRSFTSRDLRDFTLGEFAIFVQADGTRSVAVRSSGGRIPHELLDAHGIVVQPIGSHVFLLSERMMPVAGLTENLHTSHWYRLLFRKRLGTLSVRDGEQWLSGTITSKTDSVSIRFPRLPLPTIPWKQLPAGTFAAVATSSLLPTDTRGITETIETLLRPFNGPGALFLEQREHLRPQTVVLQDSTSGVHFLISTSSDGFDREQQGGLLRLAAALETPKIRTWILPDNTSAAELIADPSAVTVEEVVVSGVPVMRVQADQSGELLVAQQNERVAITNSNELIDFWLRREKQGESPACFGNNGFIHLNTLFDSSDHIPAPRSLNAVQFLSSTFPYISVDSSMFSTTVRLCRH